MSVTRRTFLGTLAASLALRPGDGWAEESPILKFGVLSDCHVGEDPKSAEALRKELMRLSREGVRLVAICGDICHNGTLRELRNVTDVWKEAFPGEMNAAGESVEPFFAWGNHDYHDASYMQGKPLTEEDIRQAILTNKDKAWEMVTGRKHPGEIFLRKVCGVTFVGAHWTHYGDELKPWLDAHREEIPTDRPVFFVQHSHPLYTCFGKWLKWYDRNREKMASNLATLKEHPNFFVMSGHSHVSCSFDDAIWQGGFVSMAAGCASGGGPRRYEYNVSIKGKRAAQGETRHMPGQDAGEALQASVVTVYPSRVVVTRWDERFGERIGEDWDVPFPFVHDTARPWRIAAAARAPEFPAGAEIRVEPKTGLLYPAGREVPQVHLTFPCAGSVGPHSRVIDYRVSVTRADTGAAVAERLVAQRGISLAERRTRELEGWCAFGQDELPRGARLVATVEPLNAGGKAGKPIRKEFET